MVGERRTAVKSRETAVARTHGQEGKGNGEGGREREGGREGGRGGGEEGGREGGREMEAGGGGGRGRGMTQITMLNHNDPNAGE